MIKNPKKVEPKEYTVAFLVQNQSFRRVVNGTASISEIEEWDNWIEKDDQNRQKAKQAMTEISGFEFSEPKQVDVEVEWQKLSNHTIKKRGDGTKKKPNSSSPIAWVYRVAAVLLLGTMIGVGFYIYTPANEPSTHLKEITQERTVVTGDREQKTIKFSNGSRVVLNNNSVVTYILGKGKGQTINVIVEGEVFFDARGNPARTEPVFAVETPDGIIRDIGTKFLVVVERDRSRVVLQEGRVEVNTKDKNDTAAKISVSNGEMLEFTKTKILKKQKVNSTFYTSWATGSMQFDQTSIREFAGFVEQRFDVKVEIVDPDLADIRIDGGVYYRSLEELVRSVSGVAHIPVYQSKDRETVYIGNTNRGRE